MLARAGKADVVVMAAAVADFRPKVAAGTKLHKADGVPELVLEPPRTSWPVWAGAAGRARSWWASRPRRTTVAERAAGEAAGQGVDLMVANDVTAPGVGFDHDTNAVTIFGADGSTSTVALRTKDAVADAILDRVARCCRHGEPGATTGGSRGSGVWLPLHRSVA